MNGNEAPKNKKKKAMMEAEEMKGPKEKKVRRRMYSNDGELLWWRMRWQRGTEERVI